jgi:hypothetical protein
MNVYVVEYSLPYEGSELNGIFSTEEKAKAFVVKRDPEWTTEKMKSSGGEGYFVYSVELDSE